MLIIVALVLVVAAFWSGGTAAASGEPGDDAPSGGRSGDREPIDEASEDAPSTNSLPDSEFQLTQTMSIRFGAFRGDRDAFMRHEDGNVPSLNPEIQLEGLLRLRTWLRPDLHIRLQTAIPGEATAFDGAALAPGGSKTTFGIGWRQWDAEYGLHSFRFDPAGLPYTKAGVGLRLRYGQPDEDSGLRLIVARSNTRSGEATIRGDDTFGPFFLGQKRIVPFSDGVLMDDRRLQRGERPGDGDYYIDYEGGFIHFHFVLLAHETASVTYEYSFDDTALASEFTGVVATRAIGETQLHAFALRDHTPVEERPITRISGSTLLAYGANVRVALPSGSRLQSGIVATEFQQQFTDTRGAREEFVLKGDRVVYKLAQRSIVYESERITWMHLDGEAEQLVRHLDYTVDYHNGELTLYVVPVNGAVVEVRYEYVDGGGLTVKPPLRGLQSANRYEYGGERGRGSTWFNVVDGDFVNVATGEPPTVTLDAGTEARYSLGEGWSLLGDAGWTEQRTMKAWRGSVGVEYRRQRLETRLQWGREVLAPIDESAGTDIDDLSTPASVRLPAAEIDHIKGSLRWRGGADVHLDLKQTLGTYGGGVPERLSASVVGTLRSLPVSIAYTHGDKHYDDKVEARLTVPAQGRSIRGAATFVTRWLYVDGLHTRPRTVHSVIGNFIYNSPAGMYTRGEATATWSGLGGFGTRTYDVRFDTGRSVGASGLIDYSLRLNGRETYGRFGPSPLQQTGQDTQSVSHTVTLAGTVLDSVYATLLWRQSEGSRRRSGRGGITTIGEGEAAATEQGWQLSLQRSFGALDVTLSHGTSASVHLGAARSEFAAADLQSAGASGHASSLLNRTRLETKWEKEGLSIKGTFEYSLYSGSAEEPRSRKSAQIRPEYDMSETARLWLAYDFVTGTAAAIRTDSIKANGSVATNRSNATGEYASHTLRVGITMQF